MVLWLHSLSFHALHLWTAICWQLFWFHGFTVSWFHGFMVSWFHGFVVLPTPISGHQMPIGFVVSWFHGFMVSSSPSLIFITMFQKSRAQNNETTKPWNLQSFWRPRFGSGWNHETVKPTVILMTKRWEWVKPPKHETYSHFSDLETE